MELLARQDWLGPFYLAGGTALALHLGHRFSEDLDFFSKGEVDPKRVRSLLGPLGSVKVEMEREGTLWATLGETKISFFHYEYPLLESPVDFGGVKIAAVKDIACMKLDTLSSRGSRKDFIDLYFLLRSGPTLQEIFRWFLQKFEGIDFNRAHLLKSLTYFEDAERDVPPHMIQKMSWEEVKSFFQKEAKKVAFLA